MTKDVVTVRQGTSLPAAADLIVAKKISGVPVRRRRGSAGRDPDGGLTSCRR